MLLITLTMALLFKLPSATVSQHVRNTWNPDTKAATWNLVIINLVYCYVFPTVSCQNSNGKGRCHRLPHCALQAQLKFKRS